MPNEKAVIDRLTLGLILFVLMGAWHLLKGIM